MKDIELLIGELGEYGKTLGTVEEISTAVFDILNLSEKSNEEDLNHNVWIENLQNTERFPGYNKIISDNVFAHQVRLSEVICELDFFIDEIINKGMNGININIPYIYWLALIHDDSEGISPFKDIPTTIKLSLSEYSKKTLSILEEGFIEVLSKYHKENLKYGMTSEELKQLYLDSEYKTSMEGQFVSYLDKVDGFMSCLHEIYNGNKTFIEPFKNYIKILTDIRDNKEKYPKIRFILDGDIKGIQNKIKSLPGFDMDNDADFQKDIIKRNSNRSSNVLDLFNIDGLLEIENHLDEILNTSIIDKSDDYRFLYETDLHFPEYKPRVYTTKIKSYESWKIAYAKMNYTDLKGNQINGYDAMYGKCELPYKFNIK